MPPWSLGVASEESSLQGGSLSGDGRDHGIQKTACDSRGMNQTTNSICRRTCYQCLVFLHPRLQRPLVIMSLARRSPLPRERHPQPCAPATH